MGPRPPADRAGPWQCWVLTTVFGWVDEAGNRRFKKAYTEIPRKNAKSTLSSGVALYLLTADGEPGAEVYSAATTRDQAKIVWGDAKAMATASPWLPQSLRRRVPGACHRGGDPEQRLQAAQPRPGGNWTA